MDLNKAQLDDVFNKLIVSDVDLVNQLARVAVENMAETMADMASGRDADCPPFSALPDANDVRQAAITQVNEAFDELKAALVAAINKTQFNHTFMINVTSKVVFSDEDIGNRTFERVTVLPVGEPK